MSDPLDLGIAFASGGAAVVATALGFRQYRQAQPSVALVSASGSSLLPPSEEEYSWCFRLGFQNQRNAEYAVSDVLWAPNDRSLRKKIPHHEEGWQTLVFPDTLRRPSGGRRSPLLFAPFEYHEVRALWRNSWVRDPRAESAMEYWRSNREAEGHWHSALEHLHNRTVSFLVRYSDGRSKTFQMKRLVG